MSGISDWLGEGFDSPWDKPELDQQRQWLAQYNPVVYVFGEGNIDEEYLWAAKAGIEELVYELDLNIRAAIVNPGNGFDAIVEEAFRGKDYSSQGWSELILKLKQEAAAGDYKPCCDAFVTGRKLTHFNYPDYWGEADDYRGALIVTTRDNRRSPEAVKGTSKHEFGHLLGISYPVRGQNCNADGCLMTYSQEGDHICSECESKAFDNLREKEQKHSNIIFNSSFE